MLKELINEIKNQKESAQKVRKVGLELCAREHEKRAYELSIHLMLRD